MAARQLVTQFFDDATLIGVVIWPGWGQLIWVLGILQAYPDIERRRYLLSQGAAQAAQTRRLHHITIGDQRNASNTRR